MTHFQLIEDSRILIHTET